MQELILKPPRPHAWQQKILSDPTPYIVATTGRQLGKTTLAEQKVLLRLAKGHHFGYYAPKYKLLDEPFRRVLRRIPPELIKSRDLTAKRLELINGGLLKGWSLEDPDAGRGSTDHEALVDEAGLVPNLVRIWEENISPTLARHRGRASFVGTPKGRNGFWQLACLGMDPQRTRWAFFPGRSSENPFLPADYEQLARETMTERSFRQEILGEFLDNGGEVISGLDEIISLGVTRIEPQQGQTYRAGLDLAKSVDWSVLSIFDNSGQQVLLERWQGVPWAETIRRAVKLVEPYRALLTVDATGVGDPVYDAIRKEWPRTEPFKFTEQSRADLLNALILQFEQMQLRLLDNQAQRAELESLEWAMTPRGKARLQVPNSMHDDIIMADALAVYGQTKYRPTYEIY